MTVNILNILTLMTVNILNILTLMTVNGYIKRNTGIEMGDSSWNLG